MKLNEERLNIPYIKLKFKIVFPKESILPKEKVSALRGGMGEMLLLQNCVGVRDCPRCRFEEACIVRSTMYTRMKRKPAFMQGDDSIGYLLECENHRTVFHAGDSLFFYLVLFGNNIVYFGQYLQAFYQLGVTGIGKDKAKFRIEEISNGSGQNIFKDSMVDMRYYRYETVNDYVERRMHRLREQICQNRMVFHTPLCLKFRGEYLREFHAEAIFQAVFRRIMMMDYFLEKYLDMPEVSDYPDIQEQMAEERVVQRYSSTQDARIRLKGIAGTVCFDYIPEELLPFLLAGELLHIGKNSSFGFGRYTIC